VKDSRRVSFVLPLLSREPAGGYLVVYEYANYLSRHGWDVTIIHPHQLEVLSGATTSLRDRLRLRKYRGLSGRLVRWFELDKRVRVSVANRWSADSVPDGEAVFATAWETAGPVVALPQSKGRKFYLVQHFENWSGPQKDVLATFQMPFTIVVISPWLEDIVRDAGAQRVVHISNGIDHSSFCDLSLPRKTKSILTMYSPRPFKGVPDALRAIELVHAEDPEVAVTMFGVPERAPEIPEYVTYVRNPSRTTLVDLYNRSSIYVSASITEGWALPPAEAMACGALFVGTDSGGCRDYADPEVTALLSPPSEPLALYRNLKRALAGGPEIEAIRRRGAEHIKAFTWEASGAKMRALLEGA
jgi:glycosyltransferase involved in cell wall biosynthesis